MLSRWPIRRKLLAAIGLLAAICIGLSIGGFSGVYKYRALAKGVSRRATELPLASQLAQDVSDMRVIVARLDSGLRFPDSGTRVADRLALQQAFQIHMVAVEQTLNDYTEQLDDNESMRSPGVAIGESEQEWDSVRKIRESIAGINILMSDENWILAPETLPGMESQLDELHQLSTELPEFLHSRMSNFADDVRLKYRGLIFLTATSTIAVLLMMLFMVQQFYRWVFQPLQTLIRGSRKVATGDFEFQIEVDSQDEMRELSDAMNNMTKSFRDIRDDLDGQVQARTTEVVQSERLASVGFLAAGVAHEINNPLASIALCAESLEDRLHDLLQSDDELPDDEHDSDITVVRNYLRMIQDEAFRCKKITERLLDFSRISEVEKQNTDMNEIVQGVIDMVRHIGQYKEKNIVYEPSDAVIAPVNTQEMKQVVLNLITNALDSLDRGGEVRVSLRQNHRFATLSVKDDGCGMSPEVLEHLFEPFFTRRRDGQGTGLGLSITYRIVTDHGGRLEARSAGHGKGSELIVQLPLTEEDHKELHHQYHQVA